MKTAISVCIITKNAAPTIARTLDALTSFPEVIVLDNGSKDETLAIASHYPNVRTFTSTFIGFGPLRNKAASLAQHDWILALDSDEILSTSLIQALACVPLDPKCAYIIRRRNFYRGKWIKGCGWNPEWVVRLYHKEETSYSNAQVHESVLTQGMCIKRIEAPVLHTPYRSTEDFLAKMQQYTTLFAQQYQGKRTSSFRKALCCAAWSFVRSYLLKRGLFDGREGFIISWYNANTTFYKYLKLHEANQNQNSGF